MSQPAANNGSTEVKGEAETVHSASDAAPTEKTAEQEEIENKVDDSKVGGEEEDEEQHDDEDNANANESAENAEKLSLRSSLFVKIIGFKRSANLDEELKSYHRFFTKSVEVEAPSVQIPGPEDKWVYFEMKSLEDKNKLFKHIRKIPFEGLKLAAKVVSIKPNIESRELNKMSIDDGLNILYPLQESLYAQQIKTKHAAAKELMEKIIPKDNIMKYAKAKKYLKTIRIREMLPMYPIEGYENSTMVCTEKDPTTGETIYGIRVLSSNKEASVIIPLEECISVPHQLAFVAKKVVAALPDADITPYEHTTKEGDLLGFSLRMTSFGSFLMTVIIPKVTALAFRQLTPDGVNMPEGEKTDESYSALIKKRIEQLKVKLEKFFKDNGPSTNIESIYVVMVHASNLMTSMEDTNSGSFHIIGQKQLAEKLNGINLRMSWERDGQIEVFRPLLSLIEAHGNIKPTTRLYLATPYRLLALYFAKRCAHVTMFFFWTKEHMNELQQWAKQLGYQNIDFVNARTQLRKKFPNENAATIFWQFTKPTLLERFVISEVRTVILISYWGRVIQENNINLQKKQLESVYSKLRITHICPFDLAPYKERYGMAVFFNGGLNEALEPLGKKFVGPNKMPAKALVRTMGGRMPFAKGPRFDGKPQGTAFDRLGPPREQYRKSSWGRPDPWQGQSSSSQFGQMASGVMQNLQAVSQQMQAFIPSLLHGSQSNPRNSGPAKQQPNWSNKRRYDQYSDDDDNNPENWGPQGGVNEQQYSYGKRRREDTHERGTGGGDAGRWTGSNTWGETQDAPPARNTYGDPPANWSANRGEPSYYEKGRTTTPAAGWNNSTPNTDWNNSSWNSSYNKNYY